uniref:Uncharacterized protein n=1 Tax=Pseudomonas migulae TaxID=78543 RepID=R4IU34_9PSED|nr:hypothetical protein [Pseudomonas migulae]AGC70404.1 hypothetical protein pD2RT_050 [Pseudomonas migulae]
MNRFASQYFLAVVSFTVVTLLMLAVVTAGWFADMLFKEFFASLALLILPVQLMIIRWNWNKWKRTLVIR